MNFQWWSNHETSAMTTSSAGSHEVERQASLAARLINAACAVHPRLIEARLLEALGRNVPRQCRTLAVPGVQAAIGIDDRPTQEFEFGNSAPGRAMTPRTPFRVASLSKPVTAMAVLTLTHRGELDLDAPVTPWLPEFAGSLRLDRITPRLLLSHAAGLADRVAVHTDASSQAHLLEWDDAHKPHQESEPGTAWRYTANGHALMQLVMERSTGLSFASIVRSRVLEPLGMHASGFDGEEAPLGTEHDEHGSPLPHQSTPSLASSGLRTCAGDLVAFGRGVLRAARGDGGLVAPALASLMLHAQPPGLADTTFTLGLHVQADATTPCLSHGGVRPGLRSLLLILPAARTVFAIIANGARGNAIIRPLRGLVTDMGSRRLASERRPSSTAAANTAR